MTIAIAAVIAALIGAAGPYVLRRMPEPTEPDDDKVTYVELSQTRGLAAWFALGSALMGGVIAWRIDHVELLPVWILIAGVGSWLVFIDWRTRLLPFLVVAPTYLLTVALVVLGAVLLGDLEVIKRAVVANVVVFAIFWLVYLLSRRTFGYGDVRLSGVLGLALGALGADQVYVGIYGGFLLNGVVAIALVVLFRFGRKQGFAFGPCMVIGAVIGAAWGSALYG